VFDVFYVYVVQCYAVFTYAIDGNQLCRFYINFNSFADSLTTFLQMFFLYRYYLCLVRQMSSEKSRSSRADVNVHCSPLLSLFVRLMIQSMAIRNRNGEKIHTCFTPEVMRNHSDSYPSCLTVHQYSSYISLML